MRQPNPILAGFFVLVTTPFGEIAAAPQGASNAPMAYRTSTATTLTSSVNPSQAGQQVKLTVQVTARNGIPTGTVNFLDGSTVLGTASLTSGVASLTTSALSAGTHALTAAYLGQSQYRASTSPVLSQVVKSAATSTTTTLTSSVNPSRSGQAITLTARVRAGNGGTPSGTVQFLDGSVNRGTATLTGGAASLTISSLSVGTHSLKAAYSGGGSYAASTSPALSQVVTQTGNRATTVTTLTSSANPVLAGKAITLSATVTAASGTPTGSVQFLDGSSVLATANLAAGRASLTISSLAAGTHSLVASYSGDSSYAAGASAALLETITFNPATTTTLTSSLNPSTLNQAVTFTAVVTATSGSPTGTVRFLNGSAVLATVTVAGGKATTTVSSLTVGAHSITATYSGDSTHSASSSAVISQQVTAHSVTLTWGAATSASIVGYNVYRAGTSTGPYSRLNSTPVTGVSYKDSTVQSGHTYYYVCTTVNSQNVESSYSNQAQAVVP